MNSCLMVLSERSSRSPKFFVVVCSLVLNEVMSMLVVEVTIRGVMIYFAGRNHDMLNGETAVSGTISLPAKEVSILLSEA